ncbi:hypothetical protein ACIN8IBEIGE_70017 [Acinetobacter sp. 8I-beige]|nr:hypothetical protein ACIN8IBEIGE_70017 [Acinetobacter sp. 8I-beige]
MQFFIGIRLYKLYMMHIVMVITQRHYTYYLLFVFLLFFMTLLDFFFKQYVWLWTKPASLSCR